MSDRKNAFELPIHEVDFRVESREVDAVATFPGGTPLTVTRIVPRTVVTYTVYLPLDVEAEFVVRRVAK